MPDASTQTTKGKNIFLLPKKFVKVEEWEKQICWNCNDCPATHRTYRDAFEDYELLCDECYDDEYPESEDEEDEMKEICIFEAWDRKYGANVAEKDKETEFQKKRHLFSDAYDKQEEEEDVCCVGCGDRVCGFHEEPDHKDDRDEAVCNDCYECIEEEETQIKPFDVYEGDDGVKIMCFKTDETHIAETQIFRYYDEKKWWLKHKTDDYFLLIETKTIIKKKNLFAKKKKLFVIDSA